MRQRRIARAPQSAGGFVARCVALALQYCNPQPLLTTDLLPLEFPLGLGGNKVSLTSAECRFCEVDSQRRLRLHLVHLFPSIKRIRPHPRARAVRQVCADNRMPRDVRFCEP